MNFNFIWKYFLGKDNIEDEFYNRMKKYIENTQTYYKDNKYYIVTVKSNTLLKNLNTHDSISNKIQFIKENNKRLENTSSLLYKRFSPSMIYACNNEINLVFNDSSLYNGNISKIVSSISSYATFYYTSYSGVDDVFFGYTVQFKEDFETLNYIKWRYLDCIRNISNMIWSCSKDQLYNYLDPTVPTLNKVIKETKIYTQDIPDLYGFILKKKYNEHNKQLDDTDTLIYYRKSIEKYNPEDVLHIKNDFSNTFVKFIKNNYLDPEIQ